MVRLLFDKVNDVSRSSLSMWHFWATNKNQMWAVFLVNLSSHYHIYTVKYLENLGEAIVLTNVNVHFWFQSVVQKCPLYSSSLLYEGY